MAKYLILTLQSAIESPEDTLLQCVRKGYRKIAQLLLHVVHGKLSEPLLEAAIHSGNTVLAITFINQYARTCKETNIFAFEDVEHKQVMTADDREAYAKLKLTDLWSKARSVYTPWTLAPRQIDLGRYSMDHHPQPRLPLHSLRLTTHRRAIADMILFDYLEGQIPGDRYGDTLFTLINTFHSNRHGVDYAPTAQARESKIEEDFVFVHPVVGDLIDDLRTVVSHTEQVAIRADARFILAAASREDVPLMLKLLEARFSADPGTWDANTNSAVVDFVGEVLRTRMKQEKLVDDFRKVLEAGGEDGFAVLPSDLNRIVLGYVFGSEGRNFELYQRQEVQFQQRLDEIRKHNHNN
jgi:hypothetical protein